MERVTKDPEIRRTEILDAAEGLFRTKGYDSTSIRDIVTRIKVAQGTFYYHFPSKEALVEALADRFIQSIADIVEGIAADPTLGVVEKIESIIDRLLNLNDSNAYLLEYAHRQENAILHHKLGAKALRTFPPMIEKLLIRGNGERATASTDPKITAEILVILLEYLQETDALIKDRSMTALRKKATAAVIARLLGVGESRIRIR